MNSLYLHLHQGRSLRRLNIFEAGSELFDAGSDQQRFACAAAATWMPVHARLEDLLARSKGRLRLGIWVSGLLLEQAEEVGGPLLDSLRRLRDTGHVDWLEESYYHSAAFLYAPGEFAEQVGLHRRRIREVFGQEPAGYAAGAALRALGSASGVAPAIPVLRGSERPSHVLIDYSLTDEDWGRLGQIMEALPRGRGTRRKRGDANPAPRAVGSVAALRLLEGMLVDPLICDAQHQLFALEPGLKSRAGGATLHRWRCLQATDLMQPVAHGAGGRGVGAPVQAPGTESRYEAYINYMTALERIRKFL